MIELTVRLVASLAIVVGLLLLTAKVAGKRFTARAGAPVRVVHRQALSRGSAVAVVEVGGRTLVLGTTEHQVSLLTELDADDLAAEDGEEAPVLRLERPVVAPAADQDDDFAPALAAAIEDPEPEPATAAPVGRRRKTGAHAAPAGKAAKPTRPGARAARPAARPTADGALGGSVLSPDTWRQAVAAVRGRA
jgi:flagellar protein FliO/FliZ